METTTCTTIVLVLLWLHLCCQALGFLVTLIKAFNSDVLPTTTTLSTVLLAVCLWQCHKAGYLVSPMTRYHWALLVLLVLLQVVAVVLEERAWGIGRAISAESIYPIYGVAALLVVLLGSTLFCGWKSNLFCRPCCKSQYICYGSAVVVVLVVLGVVAITASLVRYSPDTYNNEGLKDLLVISYLDKILVPCSHFYATTMIWNTIVMLPYTVPEVVALVSSALAMGSLFAVAVVGGSQDYKGLSNTIGYSIVAVHLVSLGITWYCLEYKEVFHWPKNYMCFGLLLMVMLGALVAVLMITQIAKSKSKGQDSEAVKYTLMGYSLLLMVPTLWYAYRCGLLTWKWNSCVPKKKGLKGTASADIATADTDIARES